MNSESISKFEVRLRRRNVPDDELLADLSRCASELSKDTLTVLEYTAKEIWIHNDIKEVQAMEPSTSKGRPEST